MRKLLSRIVQVPDLNDDEGGMVDIVEYYYEEIDQTTLVVSTTNGEMEEELDLSNHLNNNNNPSPVSLPPSPYKKRKRNKFDDYEDTKLWLEMMVNVDDEEWSMQDKLELQVLAKLLHDKIRYDGNRNWAQIHHKNYTERAQFLLDVLNIWYNYYNTVQFETDISEPDHFIEIDPLGIEKFKPYLRKGKRRLLQQRK